MAGRFRIEDGRVLPADVAARMEAQDREGEYLLQPTHPDLLCFVRAEPRGGQGPSPRTVLVGDAGGFPFPDLIAFLSQARWTGAVQVQAVSGQRTLALRDGEVRGATSNNPAERLGEVMVRLGFLSRPQLEEALRVDTPARLGRSLVDRGVVKPHDLFRCITHQVGEIFQAMVLCREGTFALLDQPPDDKTLQNVQLSSHSLLMDSIRKVDELAHFRKRIAHPRLYVAAKREGDGRLEEQEAAVLALCDGQRTLDELGAIVRLGEFDITKVVYRLLEGGYAQVSERPMGGALSPSAGDPREVIRIYGEIFQDVLGEVAKQEMAREFLAAANAALHGRGLFSSALLHGVSLDEHGRLPEASVLERLSRRPRVRGGDPLGELKQALSDLMFFLLFQAGELLESPQADELGRRAKERLAVLEPS
jgi:hypothetical protein